MDKLFSKQLAADIIEIADQKDKRISYLADKLDHLYDCLNAMYPNGLRDGDLWPEPCDHDGCPVVGSSDPRHYDNVSPIYNLYECGGEETEDCYKYNDWVEVPLCEEHIREYGNVCSNKECQSYGRNVFYCKNHLCVHLQQNEK